METDKLIEALGEEAHESQKAYRALVDYATMDERSLRKLHKQFCASWPDAPTRRITTLEKWSVKFHWQERTARWDKTFAILKADTWIKREEDLREKKWQDGDLLRKISRRELENFQLLSLQNLPTKITAGQATKMLEVASALQNAALGKPEKREQLDLTLPPEWEQAFKDEYGDKPSDEYEAIEAE